MRKLEETVQEIREKYEQVLDRVIDRVQKAHPEMDDPAMHLDVDGNYTLHVGVGKKSWPLASKGWPCGLWLQNVLLENLACEDDSDPPAKSIWLNPSRDLGMDLVQAIDDIQKAAATILSGSDLRRLRTHFSGKTQGWITYPVTESRQELMTLFLQDNAEGFVEKMAGYFEELALFVPVVDKLFEAKRKRR